MDPLVDQWSSRGLRFPLATDDRIGIGAMMIGDGLSQRSIQSGLRTL